MDLDNGCGYVPVMLKGTNCDGEYELLGQDHCRSRRNTGRILGNSRILQMPCCPVGVKCVYACMDLDHQSFKSRHIVAT